MKAVGIAVVLVVLVAVVILALWPHERSSGRRPANGARARDDLTNGLLPGVGGDDAHHGHHGDHGGGHDGGGGGSGDAGGHGGH